MNYYKYCHQFTYMQTSVLYIYTHTEQQLYPVSLLYKMGVQYPCINTFLEGHSMLEIYIYLHGITICIILAN